MEYQKRPTFPLLPQGKMFMSEPCAFSVDVDKMNYKSMRGCSGAIECLDSDCKIEIVTK